MIDTPKVIRINDSTQNVVGNLQNGVTAIWLGESPRGASINKENTLLRISGERDSQKVGTSVNNTTWQSLEAIIGISGQSVLYGRVVGSGGAQSSFDVPSVTSPTDLSINLKSSGQGTYGDGYTVEVLKSSNSTSNTGVGRLGTKIKTWLNGVFIDEFDHQNLDNDDLTVSYNTRQTGVVMTNVSVVNEAPAVGVYQLDNGVEPLAPALADYVDAMRAMSTIPKARRAIVCIDSTNINSAIVNAMLAEVENNEQFLMVGLADSIPIASAEAFVNVLTSDPKNCAVFAGWGRYGINPKRVSGVTVAVACHLKAVQDNLNRSWNVSGANTPVNKFATFERFDSDTLKRFAEASINPVMATQNRLQSGVIVGDVLSLDKNADYRQWPTSRAVTQIYGDIKDYLETVKLNDKYLIGATLTDQLTVDTAARIDIEVSAIFASYPSNMLAGGRGVGWDWLLEDVRETINGMEAVFLLGIKPSKSMRTIYIKVGTVSGRFAVLTNAIPAGASEIEGGVQ